MSSRCKPYDSGFQAALEMRHSNLAVLDGLFVTGPVSQSGDRMSRKYPIINDKMAAFIRAQQMFFVATAPLSADGHINLSPKGLDSFRILDGKTVAYLDLTGSGIETVAHLKENGRIVVMFCAFSGAPNIVRLHGTGEVLEPDHDEFEELLAQFPGFSGVRSIIRIHCTRVSDSCGFGVPLYDFVGHRTKLLDWTKRKGPKGMARYRRENNAESVDGLPGIGTASEHLAN